MIKTMRIHKVTKTTELNIYVYKNESKLKEQ